MGGGGGCLASQVSPPPWVMGERPASTCPWGMGGALYRKHQVLICFYMHGTETWKHFIVSSQHWVVVGDTILILGGTALIPGERLQVFGQMDICIDSGREVADFWSNGYLHANNLLEVV